MRLTSIGIRGYRLYFVVSSDLSLHKYTTYRMRWNESSGAEYSVGFNPLITFDHMVTEYSEIGDLSGLLACVVVGYAERLKSQSDNSAKLRTEE